MPQDDRRHATDHSKLRSGPPRVRRISQRPGRAESDAEPTRHRSANANHAHGDRGERAARQVRAAEERRDRQVEIPRRESGQGHAQTALALPARRVRLLLRQCQLDGGHHASVRRVCRRRAARARSQFRAIQHHTSIVSRKILKSSRRLLFPTLFLSPSLGCRHFFCCCCQVIIFAKDFTVIYLFQIRVFRSSGGR